jgi:hypothetical protein
VLEQPSECLSKNQHNTANGIYLYKIQASEFESVRKMLLAKLRMRSTFRFIPVLTTVCLQWHAAEAQFVIGGDPRVKPEDFEITTFADSLNYPVAWRYWPMALFWRR